MMDLGLKLLNNMVTVHVITYNEELMIEFFINHYRKNFPNCKILIYDNESTDNTIEIAKKYGCEIITYSTNNTLSDQKYLEIKNNCWKTSETDWNIICDCDELIEVTSEDLINEENLGTNCFKFEGFSMMNNTDEINISKMKYGFKDVGYGKNYLFNKKYINDINYAPGAHTSNPTLTNPNKLKYSDKIYRALHYKYLSPQYTIDRNSLFDKRLSEENKRKGWGIQYYFSDEKTIKYYEDMKINLIKII
jgi:glycosyltransferase involved in cell wall biosynthesis